MSLSGVLPMVQTVLLGGGVPVGVCGAGTCAAGIGAAAATGTGSDGGAGAGIDASCTDVSTIGPMAAPPRRNAA